MRQQETGSELGNIANKADQLAAQQQDFEQRLRRNFGQGEGNQRTAQQMADEKQKMLDAYNQLQKEMLQASRDTSGTDPNTSKQLRDAMGKSQQDEVGTKMESTENLLRQGLGQYAVMREAPVTRSLNDLKDQLHRLEAEAGKAGAAGGDKGEIATAQALNRAENIRRQMEQLARSAQQRGQGNQPGNQQGQGQQPGQQPGQGQQGGGQQAGNGARGSADPNGGGGGINGGDRNGNPGTVGSYGPYNATNFGGPDQPPAFQTPQAAEAAYNDLMRDIGRLRGEVSDDKDLAREYQDLLRRAQEMDPRKMGNDTRLNAVINGQALSEIDEVELMLRKKLEANQGSVRSTNPRNTPPGYADAVAEYYKRLSRQ